MPGRLDNPDDTYILTTRHQINPLNDIGGADKYQYSEELLRVVWMCCRSEKKDRPSLSTLRTLVTTNIQRIDGDPTLKARYCGPRDVQCSDPARDHFRAGAQLDEALRAQEDEDAQKAEGAAQEKKNEELEKRIQKETLM